MVCSIYNNKLQSIIARMSQRQKLETADHTISTVKRREKQTHVACLLILSQLPPLLHSLGNGATHSGLDQLTTKTVSHRHTMGQTDLVNLSIMISFSINSCVRMADNTNIHSLSEQCSYLWPKEQEHF